jgi:hypothetical protein
VVVPKIAGAGAASLPPQYVAHGLSSGAAEYWAIYHNSVVQYLDDNARPYLFARFAWAERQGKEKHVSNTWKNIYPGHN